MMDDEERATRAAFTRAGGTPVLTRRDDLLDVLLARIDAGGVDVASAPAPLAPLEAIPGAPHVAHRIAGAGGARPAPRPVRTGARARTIARRAAGIGIAGWIAVGVGTAAAAAIGTWLVLDPPGREAPPIETPTPSTTPSSSSSLVVPSAVPSVSPDVVPDVTAVVPDLSGLVDELPEVGPLLDPVTPLIGSVSVDGVRSWLGTAVLCGGLADSAGATLIDPLVGAAPGTCVP